MLVQEIPPAIHSLICIAFGLAILSMAANEWLRLKTDDYRHIAIGAGVLVLGRVAGLLLQSQWTPSGLCLEGILQSLALAAVIWAYLFQSFSTPQRAALFLIAATAGVCLAASVCLLSNAEILPLPVPLLPGSVMAVLLGGFALVLWARHRRQYSLWMGGVLAISLLGASAGLLGVAQVTLFTHLVALLLLTIETYRAIIGDLSAFGQELQAVGDRALQQTQNMAFLLEVSQAIAASLDLPVVLERVSEAVARAVNADWAYILLPTNDNAEEFVIAARYGWWGRRWTQGQIHRQVVVRLADFSILRHATMRQRQIVANNPEDYEQFERLHALLARPQSGPTLIQPIHLQNRSLGVMLLGHVGNQATFAEADAKLCQALVGQIATAIENARLYQNVEEQARRLADLLRVREEEATQRQAILESIADGVIVVSQSGEVVLANAAAERLLGLPRKQLQRQTVRRLYTELLKKGSQQGDDRATFEWDDRIVMGSLAPVKMADEDPLGYVAVFRDVTRERQAEKAKSKFIATVSHELRTPMTSIKGYIELLAAGAVGRVTPQQEHFLNIVGTNTERMISLVNNLITVSEMEHGPIKIEPRPVDMGQIIQEAVQAIRSQATDRGLDLALNLPAELSPARGDPQSLRQIMDNLLDNALRYTSSPGRITIWAAEADLENAGTTSQHYLVINIRDTGIGIPPEEQDHIFEKFYRSDNPLSIEAGGTGMGLAIVKSLVTAHTGRIWVESQPEKGSTFCFTIPTQSG